MRYELNSEEERIEFMIFLTERANTDSSLDYQLNRLTLSYLAEISGIPYAEVIRTGNMSKPKIEEKQELTTKTPQTKENVNETFH